MSCLGAAVPVAGMGEPVMSVASASLPRLIATPSGTRARVEIASILASLGVLFPRGNLRLYIIFPNWPTFVRTYR